LLVDFSIGLVRGWDKLFSFSFGVSWIQGFSKKKKKLWLRNTNSLTLGREDETLSACLGRVLDKLLFMGMEPGIGLGGLELENLRVVTGGGLTTSSSEEVNPLSSSSVLLRCVAKWIGCGAIVGRA
jgi:hypothetical protein